MKRFLFITILMIISCFMLSSCETIDTAVVHPSVIYVGGYPYYSPSYYHYYYYVPRHYTYYYSYPRHNNNYRSTPSNNNTRTRTPNNSRRIK